MSEQPRRRRQQAQQMQQSAQVSREATILNDPPQYPLLRDAFRSSDERRPLHTSPPKVKQPVRKRVSPKHNVPIIADAAARQPAPRKKPPRKRRGILELSFFKSAGFLWFSLLVLPPFGVYLLWRNRHYSSLKSVALTGFFSMWAVVLLAGNISPAPPADQDYRSQPSMAGIEMQDRTTEKPVESQNPTQQIAFLGFPASEPSAAESIHAAETQHPTDKLTQAPTEAVTQRPTAATLSMTHGKTNAKGVNVRQSANAKSTVVSQLSTTNSVLVVEGQEVNESGETWYAVKSMVNLDIFEAILSMVYPIKSIRMQSPSSRASLDQAAQNPLGRV